MSEQIQRQPRRQEKEEVTQEEVTFDRSQTEEVIEGCDNCLASIDEVLEEVKGRELTDSEVYDRGEPERRDYMDKSGLWWRENGYEDYLKDRDRFEQAYENITGLVLRRAGRCGC